jgi:signal transduction histidine kinase
MKKQITLHMLYLGFIGMVVVTAMLFVNFSIVYPNIVRNESDRLHFSIVNESPIQTINVEKDLTLHIREDENFPADKAQVYKDHYGQEINYLPIKISSDYTVKIYGSKNAIIIAILLVIFSIVLSVIIMSRFGFISSGLFLKKFTNRLASISLGDMHDNFKASFLSTYPELEPFLTRINKQFACCQQYSLNVVHGIGSLLTVALHGTYNIMNETKTILPQAYNTASKINARTQDSIEVSEAMQRLAKYNEGSRAMTCTIFDLRNIVNRAIETLETGTDMCSKQIIFNCSQDNDFTIFGDKAMILEVCRNLIDNAVKYGDKTIVITLQMKDKNPSLSFTNDGEIDSEDIDNIFNRFYRAHKSNGKTNETTGYGIGLSIAKTLVELHDGSIDVISSDNQTTFTVCLPRNITPSPSA